MWYCNVIFKIVIIGSPGDSTFQMGQSTQEWTK